MDREKVIKGLETCIPMKYETNEEKECRHEQCPYGRENYKSMNGCFWDLMSDALALLKEQEGQVQQWIKEIADSQLAHAPNDSREFMSLDEHLENEYKRGIWDGLQIAWNIISEGR